MSADYSIRRAEHTDAARIAALGIQVWLHTYATDGVSGAMADYVLREFTVECELGLMRDPAVALFVAESEGNLVGYAVVRFTGAGAGASTEIETLYVQEHFARRGIGAALLARARREAADRAGRSRVWLSVYENNDRAIRFYGSCGFVPDGERHFELGGERHRNVVMVADAVESPRLGEVGEATSEARTSLG